MSPLHVVIWSYQYLQRKGRIIQNNFPFTVSLICLLPVSLICLLPVSPQHEKAEVLLSSTPVHPKYHCSVWRYPHFARLSFYKEKFWDEDVYGSLVEWYRQRKNEVTGETPAPAKSTLKIRQTCKNSIRISQKTPRLSS